MLILNIAEKPSVAKSISNLMSNNVQSTRGTHKYCTNNKFQYNGNDMIFTSVLGHLFHLQFVKKYNWEQIEPDSLFYEDVVKTVTEEDVKKNIERQVNGADRVIVWTDCDREGENIAKQIETVVLGIKNVEVLRARFAGISRFEIQKAYDNLTTINNFEAEAVDSRMELDLRIGSTFTIFQTLCLKTIFDQKQIVSFGPCQIPTLGFVVERYEEIENHIEEKFWTLKLHSSKKDTGKTMEDVFSWKRERVFDHNCVLHFYNLLSPLSAAITKKETKPTTKLKPLPLRTVELQKTCSSVFKISSHKIMEISEKLYNQGYISYPRTETDSFDDKFNFRNILDNLKQDPTYTASIEQIQSNFKYPRKGRNNDMAHSPIYPLKGGQSLSGLERSIYDFISRRFLGGLCEDAKGSETYYEATIGREVFSIKAHKIIQKNYLDVYTYDSWNENEIGDYVLGEKLVNILNIEEGRTEPPGFLTESDLISLMDKNGIGTDATIHEHIQKIQERKYAKKVGASIIPEKLGIALIRGYTSSNLEFSKPFLRKNLELKLKEVCDNKLTKRQLVQEEIKTYHRLYNILKNDKQRFFNYISTYINSSNEIIDNRTNTSRNTRSNNRTRNDSTRNDTRSNNSTSRNTRSNNRTQNDSTRNDTRSNNSTSRNTRSNNRTQNDTQNNTSAENISNTIRGGQINGDKVVYCDCGNIAIKSETKNGDNQGKLFYICSAERTRCNFFKWASDPEKCFCGFDPILLVSKTESNNGRKFYKCKKAYKPCKFFKWGDSD
ncbi:DNA topoisomerase 3 [Nosema granulosis]|uniref:DNA topoisomerase n=1 Tax=Nosema granulosis TaxID=83296 RepID=A0A9P6KZM1_9MICR|nr:DNA topoisomerase 3 [Nosema granulosis]